MQHIRAVGPTVDKIIAVARGEDETDSSTESEDGSESHTKPRSDIGWQSGSDSSAIVVEFDEDSKDDKLNMGFLGSSSNGSLPSALKRKLGSVEFGPDRFGLGEKRLREGTGSSPTA
jgi:hypothetical protein